MRLSLRDKHIVVGSWDSGKTVLARWLSWQYPRAWVFDPGHQWPLAEYRLQDALTRYQEEGRGVLWPVDAEDVFPAFAQAAMQLANTCVVLDETWALFDSIQAPPKAWKYLWRRGHNRGVAIVLATHCLAGDMPKVARLTHHKWFLGDLVDNDYQRVRELLDRDAEAAVRDLGEYEVYHDGPRHSGPLPPVDLGEIPTHGADPGPPGDATPTGDPDTSGDRQKTDP